VQSSSQIITTNKPTSSFLQAGCPSCRPTNSVKALKGKISHSMDLLTPTLSLTTNSSWLHWGRVAMPLISPLIPVPLLFIPTLAWKFCQHLLLCNISFKQMQIFVQNTSLLNAMFTNVSMRCEITSCHFCHPEKLECKVCKHEV